MKMSQLQREVNDDTSSVMSEPKRRQSAKARPGTSTEDKGDTFLTDMLFKKQSTPAKVPKGTKPTMSAKGTRARSELKKEKPA